MHQFYERCAYFTAARYMRTIDRIAIDIFKPTKFAPVYAYIMFYLEDYGDASITDIAIGLGYERTTISRLVSKLEAENLICINYSGRKAIISISETGKDFLLVANQCLDKLRLFTDSVLGETKKEMTDLLKINNQKLREGAHYDPL